MARDTASTPNGPDGPNQPDGAAPIDCVAIIHARSELELTTLCVMLNSEKDIAARRDWDAFVALADEEVVLAPLVRILAEVRKHEHMHEKFWNMMEVCPAVHRRDRSVIGF